MQARDVVGRRVSAIPLRLLLLLVLPGGLLSCVFGTAFAPECMACIGVGRLDCASCKDGRAACICNAPDGCEACRTTPCLVCEGHGTLRCKACRGTGLREKRAR